MSWGVVGLATGIAAGFYNYIGGFYDVNIRVGEIPFESMDVRYHVHYDPYSVVARNVQSAYDDVLETFEDVAKPSGTWFSMPGAKALTKYFGIFYDNPAEVRDLADEAYLRYVVGVVVDDTPDGKEKDKVLADRGFKEATIIGGRKALLADFPVRTGMLRDINKLLMVRRVYPRIRAKLDLRNKPYVGAMEYFHDGVVTVIMPLEEETGKQWRLEGVDNSKK